jgi:hypothetical protein
MPLARFAAANQPAMFDALADWSAPLTADIADLARWQAVAGLLLTGTGTLRKTVDKRCGFPADKEFADQRRPCSNCSPTCAPRPVWRRRSACWWPCRSRN